MGRKFYYMNIVDFTSTKEVDVELIKNAITNALEKYSYITDVDCSVDFMNEDEDGEDTN